MAIRKNDSAMVEIPALEIKQFDLRIVGDTPLISHAWSEKAKRNMDDNANKKAKNKKHEDRKPSCDFGNSLYWLRPAKPDFDNMTDEEAQELLARIIPSSKFGFPVTAFKAAAIDAAYQQEILAKKTTARGAIHILGEFAEIEGIPTIREDMVRIGMGKPDFRWRAEFKTWATTLTIRYNAGAVSMEQIVSYFNVGGFANGVGDWRPARNGTYGTFHVE